MPIPVRTVTSTELPDVVNDAVAWAAEEQKPLTVRCGLGIYLKGDFRAWPGIRWIVELADVTEAEALTHAMSSFFKAVAVGRLADLQQTLDLWAEQEQQS